MIKILKKLWSLLLYEQTACYSGKDLIKALIKQGYSRVIVEEAIREAHLSLASEAPVLQEKPAITYEVMDENDQPVEVKKSWFKRLFGL